MNERDQLFLGHVLEAIAAIEGFTAEGRAYFMADLDGSKRCNGCFHANFMPFWMP